MKCPSCGYKLRSTMKRRKPVHKWRNGHEYLVGREAHLRRRLEVYAAAGGEANIFVDESGEFHVDDYKPANCQGCAETHPVGFWEGEWHHTKQSRGGRRCDCLSYYVIHELESISTPGKEGK